MSYFIISQYDEETRTNRILPSRHSSRFYLHKLDNSSILFTASRKYEISISDRGSSSNFQSCVDVWHDVQKTVSALFCTSQRPSGFEWSGTVSKNQLSLMLLIPRSKPWWRLLALSLIIVKNCQIWIRAEGVRMCRNYGSPGIVYVSILWYYM